LHKAGGGEQTRRAEDQRRFVKTLAHKETELPEEFQVSRAVVPPGAARPEAFRLEA